MIRQRFSITQTILTGLLLLVLPTISACDEKGTGSTSTGVVSNTTGSRTSAVQTASAQTVSQQDILIAQDNHSRKVELTVGAYVKKVLPDDTKGLPHQRFLISLNNDSTVLVAHDTAMAPRVPLNAGDFVVIHGEYIWNSKGGVLHWTHHTDSPRHEGGWIEFAGQRYQ